MSRLFRSTPEPYYATKSADAQELAKEVDNIPVVTANPELAGTEANLTGLQVGNTKYAVSGGSASGCLVTFTPVETDTNVYTYTADKTFGEIFASYESGIKPIAKIIADDFFLANLASELGNPDFLQGSDTIDTLMKVQKDDVTIYGFCLLGEIIPFPGNLLHSTNSSDYPSVVMDYSQG